MVFSVNLNGMNGVEESEVSLEIPDLFCVLWWMVGAFEAVVLLTVAHPLKSIAPMTATAVEFG